MDFTLKRQHILWRYLFLYGIFVVFPAIAFSQDVVSKNPDANRLYHKGVKYLIDHKLDLAEDAFLQSLQLDFENGKIHWETGWVYWEKKEWEQTLYHWEMTKQYFSAQKDLDRYYNIATQYLNRENISKKQYISFESIKNWEHSVPNEISFTAVGDIMMGSNFPDDSKLPLYNGSRLFNNVKQFLNGDIVFGNLEGPLTGAIKSSKPTHKKTYYVFRTPPEYAMTLKNAGFTIVNLANNHINDFDIGGIDETIESLKKQTIHYFGHITQPCAIVDVNNVKVGFLGVSTNYYCVNMNNLNQCKKLIRELKKETDLIVISFHGGAEGVLAAHTPDESEFFYGEHRGSVIQFSHAMIDEGADLVVGHGPHVLRGMEIYKNRLIAYSLGNFLGYLKFSTSGDLQFSVILNVVLSQQGKIKKVNAIPLKFNPQAVPEFDTSGYSIILLNELSRQDFGDNALVLDQNGEWHPDDQSL